METISVRCNHCGAPLQVSGATRFVTCQFCQSSLEVKRTDSSIFTQEVAQIAENTGKMAASLEVLTIQNEIDRLDRENAPAPAESSVGKSGGGEGLVAVIGLLMVIVFGVFFAVTSSQHGAPFIFPLFGGAFVLIGLIRFFAVLSKTSADSSPNRKAERYKIRRDELLKKLASYADK